MSSERERFLSRVREAVAAGNGLNPAPANLPERGDTGYQGAAGSDPVARFARELRSAGGFVHPVESFAAAREQVASLLKRMQPQTVLLGRWQLPPELGAEQLIQAAGATVMDSATPAVSVALQEYATADVGLTGCDHLIAETGTVVVRSRPEQPRSVSLLPPFHIVVARARQVIPDLFDLFALPEGPPAGLTLITGPSKTGDIEGILVTGVHGPGELHVIVVTG